MELGRRTRERESKEDIKRGCSRKRNQLMFEEQLDSVKLLKYFSPGGCAIVASVRLGDLFALFALKAEGIFESVDHFFPIRKRFQSFWKKKAQGKPASHVSSLHIPYSNSNCVKYLKAQDLHQTTYGYLCLVKVSSLLCNHLFFQ